MNIIIKNERGYSVVEILIALAILTASISAAMLLVFQGQDASIDTTITKQATYVAEAGLENARYLARQDFLTFTSIAPTTANGFTQETIATDMN